MRKTAILILAVAAVTVGCSSESDDAPTHDEQVAAVQAGEKSPQEASFEDYVRDAGFATTDADVQAVTDLAHSICDAYDRGVSFVDVIKVVTDSGYTGYEAGQLNGAATAAFCPEHTTP